MARRKKPMDDRSSMSVRHLPRVARPLVSVTDPSLKPWPNGIRGAIVRLYPSAAATEATIEAWKAKLAELGALAVRTMPKPKSAAVVVGKVHAVAKVATVRQVVEGMVEDANTVDRDALREVVGAALDAEGI